MTSTEPTTTAQVLPFTGERFTPECVREIWYEHWHRYAFAQSLAVGRRVLDAACGEGYGSAMLAQVATSVVGVDVDAATIEHAHRRYGSNERLQWHCASVTELPLADESVDLIVSFETLEHLAEQERMLDEFRRVLSRDGVLIISSPDRDTYNAGAQANPFHVRELSRQEFDALLASRFPARRLFGQKLAFQSLLWPLGPAQGVAPQVLRLDSETGILDDQGERSPVYYVAVCAGHAAALPATPDLSVFCDHQASVYAHYNQEVRRVIQGGMRILELEREVEALKARLAGQSGPVVP